MTNEAFARIKIDQLLKDTDWRLTDGISVRYEYPLDDGGRADYALFDRQGRALAVLEAKSTSVSLSAGEAQGRRYADLLDVPFIFLSNGEEIWFCDKGQDAHFRRIETVFSQDDLARRKAARDIRRSPLDIAIDSRIAGGGGRLHQSACIEAVCREIVNGRRKMLVEMATGTGKTRTAAALLKRLFEANWATRALFVVDRNTLAIQAEDAFAEHLPHLPCYRVPRTGRRFQDEKRVTIVTLQTLVNEYEKYSSGYFDLIVIDECHRSIYGQWRRALDHFDGIKVGLTATPCVMQDAPDVDDRLAFFNFFASDKEARSYLNTGSQERPDLAFLYDSCLAWREGEQSGDKVVLVEFKRPGLEAYPNEDPIRQALRYVNLIKSSKTFRDKSGRVISNVGERTSFDCYIVADLTEGLRKQLIGLPLQPTPDNEGMFGYTDNPKAFVEIVPFSKLLKDAKARNSAFFTRLGLNG